MQNLRGTTRQIFFYAFLFGGIVMLFFALFGAKLLYLFTDKLELIEHAKPYLLWIVIAPLINVAAYIWDGIYLGATVSKPLRNSMIVSMLIFLVAVYLLHTPFGNHGLWGALTILLIARGGILTAISPKHLYLG